MHPKELSIANYTYDLPKERIAEYPLAERDQSKLLIWKENNISEDIYKNIASYLPSNSLLVFNDTKVIPARIHFRKATGGVIEIFCLEPYEEGNDYSVVMHKKESVKWKCMIGGASKWKEGALEKELRIKNEELKVKVELVKKLPDAYVAKFSWKPSHYTFAEVIDASGEVPLPPYIKRKPEESDKQRYQTIFAKEEGSVAAPTAGLHFTESILTSLKQKNIKTDFLTLHVGAGTFKPVKAERMEGHEMHEEWIDVSVNTIKDLLEYEHTNVIAVGTTTTRTLESLYWMGIKTSLNPHISIEELSIKQWEVYEAPLSDQLIVRNDALNALLNWLKTRNAQNLIIPTQILIAPGYRFRIVDILITNFHQPQSTLLLLVAAAIGKEWRRIYNYALENNFRFLSFGDGCLLFIQKD
jgi:S-adenosylmethionine:tRNA ribosyltransferase-isomerase